MTVIMTSQATENEKQLRILESQRYVTLHFSSTSMGGMEEELHDVVCVSAVKGSQPN